MIVRLGRLLPTALLLLLLALPMHAAAHGGGEPQLTRVAVGDHLLYAWSRPTPATAGRPLHITLAVTRLAADSSEIPITDAAVSITALPAAGEPVTASAAPGADAGGFYYESDVTLSAGDWTIQVEVAPADGSGGAVSFPVVVAPAGNTRFWMSAGGVVLIAVAILLYAVALLRGRRKVNVPA